FSVFAFIRDHSRLNLRTIAPSKTKPHSSMTSDFDLTNNEAITRLEQLLGRSLPADYASWLVEPNAAYPMPAEVSIPDKSPWIDQIECFYAPQQILQTLHE